MKIKIRKKKIQNHPDCKCGNNRFKTYMKNLRIYECRACHRLIQISSKAKGK